MRKNYFELIKEMGFDAEFEMSQLEKLLKIDYNDNNKSLYFELENDYLYYSNRGPFTEYKDFIAYLNENYDNNIEKLFVYSEFLIDFLIDRKLYSMSKKQWLDTHKIAEQIVANIHRFLSASNHELVRDSKKHYIIIEKDVVSSEASQILSAMDTKAALKILEYNHFQNKGNLESKREILLTLQDFLETKRDELESIDKNGETVIRLFKLFNKLDLRHGQSMFARNVNKKELEHWYDNIYTLIIYVILLEEKDSIVEESKELV